MPGSNDKFLESFTTNKEEIELDDDFPELLPVSCGYFSAIVEELMEKERMMILKYILIDTKGQLFDRLAGYIEYSSLSKLLVNLMRVNLLFPSTGISSLNSS